MELIVHTVCLQLFHISYPKILHLGDRIMADYMAPDDDAFSGAANYEERLWNMYLSEQGVPSNNFMCAKFLLCCRLQAATSPGKSTDASTGGDDDAAVPCQRVGVFNIVPH